MLDLLPELPAAAARTFTLIVAAVVMAITAGVYLNGRRMGYPRGGARRLAADIFVGTLIWLALTGFLARRGLFLDFKALPPRIIFAVLPSLAIAALIFFSPKTREFFRAMPVAWLIALQTFRLPLEIVLDQLADAGAAPRVMTYEGRNFDILTGITAPIVAYLVVRGGELYNRIAIGWNVAGLILLANVVGHGFLAAPTRWQVLTEAPGNTFIARFPFIWLVTLLVPLAALLHALSLRGLANPSVNTLERGRPGLSTIP